MLISAIIGTIIILIATSVILLFLIYNNLKQLRANVDNSWKLIDAELNKRFELIPGLTQIIKVHMKYEMDTLNAIIEANNQYNSSKTTEEKSIADSTLTYNLKSIFALSEAYPELKSDESFKDLQKELSLTENNINYKKQLYNENVKKYNTALDCFPNRIFKGKLGFYEKNYFEI